VRSTPEAPAPAGPQVRAERRRGARGLRLHRRRLHPDRAGLRQALVRRQPGAVPRARVEAHGRAADLQRQGVEAGRDRRAGAAREADLPRRADAAGTCATVGEAGAGAPPLCAGQPALQPGDGRDHRDGADRQDRAAAAAARSPRRCCRSRPATWPKRPTTAPTRWCANTSAEAMDIAATRIDAKSEIYLDNMAQSVQREGEIYLGMAARSITSRAATVETMSEDGEDGEACCRSYTDGDRHEQDPQRLHAGQVQGHRRRHRGDRDAARQDGQVDAAHRHRRGRGAGHGARAGGDPHGGHEPGRRGHVRGPEVRRKRLVGMGVVEPNEEEKAEMEAAQQNQQPDPHRSSPRPRPKR
jgi:hypothetical protein